MKKAHHTILKQFGLKQYPYLNLEQQGVRYNGTLSSGQQSAPSLSTNQVVTVDLW